MKKLTTLLVVLLITLSGMATTGNGRLKVGLVLGGGGAKGAAEVGVLKIIEQVGIPIDYIAGTSIGSIVGGLYSVGYRSADIDTMFCSQEWVTLLSDREPQFKDKLITKKDGITYVLGFPVGRKGSKLADSAFGAMRGDNIIELLDSMTQRHDSINFDELPIPFRCVAVDFKTLHEVVLSKGHLPIAMRASMAIPGAFKPVKLDSMELIDGGALNNLPVDVVRKMGADVVIAIDLTQNKRETRNKEMKPAKGAGALVEWVISRPDLKKYNENRKNCDVYINPDLKGYDATSFSPAKITDMIKRGEVAGEAAREQLEQLKLKVLKGHVTQL
jgi:NTE family protein